MLVILVLPPTETKIIDFLLIGQETLRGPRPVLVDSLSPRAPRRTRSQEKPTHRARPRGLLWDEQSPSVRRAPGVSGCQLPSVYYWFAVYREAGQAISNNSVQMGQGNENKACAAGTFRGWGFAGKAWPHSSLGAT